MDRKRRENRDEQRIEADLIARIRGGDRAAFETAYRHYWPALVAFAEQYGAYTRHDAQATAQEIFFSVWLNRARGVAPHGLEAYLLGAMVSRIGPALQLYPLAATIDAIIASMPARCRDVYRLIHELGMDTSAVASLLNLSIGTVRRRHARALHLLVRGLATTEWGDVARQRR